MKEKMHCKCYLRYCDDTMGLARTKAEAWAMVNEYESLSEEKGLVVKAGIIMAPIAHLEHGKGKKKRRRQRSKRPKNRLSGVCVQQGKCPTPEECKA